MSGSHLALFAALIAVFGGLVAVFIALSAARKPRLPAGDTSVEPLPGDADGRSEGRGVDDDR